MKKLRTQDTPRDQKGIAINVSPSAGKPAERSTLVNVPRLVTANYAEKSDASVPAQLVAFGTRSEKES